MAVIVATGKPLPKFIPSFAWFLEGVVTKGFGRKKLYEIAATATGRRGQEWTPAMQRMWDEIFDITAAPRQDLIRHGRREMRNRNR